MKRIIFIIMVLTVCSFAGNSIASETGNKQGSAVVGPYNPAVTYPGVYIAEQLLFKNRPTSTTWQSIPKLDRLQQVTCSDAVAQLQREGKWQGHLKLDGSCGSTVEAPVWELGNRLNYDEAQEQGSR